MIKELVDKIKNKKVLYMYDPLGNIKLKIYDKDYKLVLSDYGNEEYICKILKAFYE